MWPWSQSALTYAIAYPQRIRMLLDDMGPLCTMKTGLREPAFKRYLGVCGGGGGNRTRVREPSTVRTTCLAWLFELRLAPANRQADARLAASTDLPGQAARPGREADVNDAAPNVPGLAHQQTSAASSRC